MKYHLLKTERRRRGWTQAKVAEAVGVDAKTVGRWERGKAIPYPYYREQLCALFGKNAEQLGLLYGDEESTLDNAVFLGVQSGALDMPVQVSFLADPAIPLSLESANNLVGRDDLLTQMKERLCAGESLALTAQDGLPGIGKTALAAALATDWQVQENFYDGILWAGLGPRSNVLSHLARWGKLLGVIPSQVENISSREAWGQALKAAIGRRRLLLVIDDAWKTEDALALRVGGSGCTHLLTTRWAHVASVFTQEGTIMVPPLQETDGMALLARFVPEVVEEDPEGAQTLVQAVDGLPLALILMGSYLTSRFSTNQPLPLQAALTELNEVEQCSRLSLLPASGEYLPNFAETMPLHLYAAIALSNQQLSPQAHTALRALSIFPPEPETFSEESALALCQQPVEILEELQNAGLLETWGPGRYKLHQTITYYGRVQSQTSNVQQQLPGPRSEHIEADEWDRHQFAERRFLPQPIKNVPTYKSSNRFSWYSWDTLSKVLLVTLLITIGLLVLSSLPLLGQGQASNISTGPVAVNYEAEAEQNTLAGGAKVAYCRTCSGGEHVRYIGGSGTLQFNNVIGQSAGHYQLTIYYSNGEAPGTSRTLDISVNAGPAIVRQAPGLGKWGSIGTLSLTVSLNAGENIITLSNPTGNAPDIDKISVTV